MDYFCDSVPNAADARLTIFRMRCIIETIDSWRLEYTYGFDSDSQIRYAELTEAELAVVLCTFFDLNRIERGVFLCPKTEIIGKKRPFGRLKII